MSKLVKDLISQDISRRLSGVNDALLVNVIGMSSKTTVALRRKLRSKGVELMVVKNSLARRATEGTPLAAAFHGLEGCSAVVWGAEDIISLAKHVAKIDEDKEFDGFELKGGVMDGEKLSATRVKEVSKWPNRLEQLSILAGQILSPGATLAAQLVGPGGALASQVKQKGEGEAAEEAAAAS